MDNNNSKDICDKGFPKITYSNKKIEVDYTTGKIAEDIAWAKKLVESGAFKRLDEFIKQQRRDKNLEK